MLTLDPLLAALAIMAVVVAVAVTSWWVHRQRRRARWEALLRLADRDGMRPTSRPCGLDAATLAARYAATPRGVRRYGIRYALEGAREVDLGAVASQVEVGCFAWWYEERVDTGQGRHHRRRTTTVAVARLPVRVPGQVTVQPSNWLGRTGLARGDQQVESAEFNRRFRVDGSDPQLIVRFLDPGMQHRLVTDAVGRTLHLDGDVVVLGGSPSHRDDSLPGVIGELPAVAQDLIAVLRAAPAQLWRTTSQS